MRHAEPGLLQAHYRDYNQMTYARSVLVIHNMAHQGRGPMADLAFLEVLPTPSSCSGQQQASKLVCTS